MSHPSRENALKQIALGRAHTEANGRPGSLNSLPGQDVFSRFLMRERLPQEVFKRLESLCQSGGQLDPADAGVVASSMKDWALARGVTHYTHWFHPMTGQTAEKHDSFLTPSDDGQIINEFSGKMLIMSEPDASSFPSGGLRSTFEARGYTAWDPTSPAFIINKTLYIPTVFYSYTGEALDRKIPLLRSTRAVSQAALRLLKALGDQEITAVEVMTGAEQEFFLVDRRLYMRRPDLMMCGRTLYGHAAPKGQELEDHYFGAIPERVLAFMQDAEERLFALGVPVHTRHNEAAPAQFELVPVYEGANIASDHNMLIMEILRSAATDHDLACLLHEKPFQGVNGSGKHNNWSLRDNLGRNLLDPGKTPWNNSIFLLCLAALMRASHLHAAVLRLGFVGAGNDYRLGVSEAPPAVISIYVGRHLEKVIDSLIAGCETESDNLPPGEVELGLQSSPKLTKDTADRNRTSPFSFTGNKFEFRALGASQALATINITINAAVALAFNEIAEDLEKAVAAGREPERAAREILRQYFKEHRPVIFNGDNYSAEWAQEAARRGLKNLPDSVSALELYSRPEVMRVFKSQGILTEEEMLSRQEILLSDYTHRLAIEGRIALDLGRTQLQPAALRWQAQLGQLALTARELGDNEPERTSYTQVRTLCIGLARALDRLEAALETKDDKTVFEEAVQARDRILPALAECRALADRLEGLVPAEYWPLPSYAELFWLY